MGEEIRDQLDNAVAASEERVDDRGCAGDAGLPGQSVAEARPRKRVRTMVFSRVVGYYQPVQQWNIGKQQEFSERTAYMPPARLEERR